MHCQYHYGLNWEKIYVALPSGQLVDKEKHDFVYNSLFLNYGSDIKLYAFVINFILRFSLSFT
jgi:hypothetical protein